MIDEAKRARSIVAGSLGASADEDELLSAGWYALDRAGYVWAHAELTGDGAVSRRDALRTQRRSSGKTIDPLAGDAWSSVT